MPVPSRTLLFSIGVMLLASGAASASVHKCVDAHGVISYSDQPCADKDGQKPAEVRNTADFAIMAARDTNRKVGRMCVVFNQRRGQCYADIGQRLSAIFADRCDAPSRYFTKLRQQERQQPEDDPQGDDDELGKTIPCDSLQIEIWKFVKENFGSKLSPDEIKAIDYQVYMPPSHDGTDSPAPRYRKRR